MPQYAYFQKKLVPIEEAKISIMTHAFNYGTSCFEGIRGNWNSDDSTSYVFRPKEHFDRLRESAKMIKIKLPNSSDELMGIMKDLVSRCAYREDIYIRPVAYKGQAAVANLRLHTLEDDFHMFIMPLGNYLDPTKGLRCMTSTWRRSDDLAIPPRAKIGGMYINSVLSKTEAVLNGYDEAIMLNADGHVSEGSGENVFIISKGKLVTPAVTDNVLVGITRDSIIQVAKNELGMETVERSMDRSEMYLADEMFLTGTAAHLTPVVEVDHYEIGNGEVGPTVKKLQALYFDIIRGKNKKYSKWSLPIQAGR